MVVPELLVFVSKQNSLYRVKRRVVKSIHLEVIRRGYTFYTQFIIPRFKGFGLT